MIDRTYNSTHPNARIIDIIPLDTGSCRVISLVNGKNEIYELTEIWCPDGSFGPCGPTSSDRNYLEDIGFNQSIIREPHPLGDRRVDSNYR